MNHLYETNPGLAAAVNKTVDMLLPTLVEKRMAGAQMLNHTHKRIRERLSPLVSDHYLPLVSGLLVYGLVFIRNTYTYTRLHEHTRIDPRTHSHTSSLPYVLVHGLRACRAQAQTYSHVLSPISGTYLHYCCNRRFHAQGLRMRMLVNLILVAARDGTSLTPSRTLQADPLTTFQQTDVNTYLFAQVEDAMDSCTRLFHDEVA